jgi:hypothetical protein
MNEIQHLADIPAQNLLVVGPQCFFFMSHHKISFFGMGNNFRRDCMWSPEAGTLPNNNKTMSTEKLREFSILLHV